MNKLFKIGFLLLVVTSIVACDVSNEKVVTAGETSAGFTYVKEVLPGKISLINTSENADSFMWDFGDNTTSTEKNPVKTFKKTGNYDVKLTVTYSKTGESKSFSSTISMFIFEGGLVVNGDFELGNTPWTMGTANPLPAGILVASNGNTYASFNVAAAGNPFDVNLSQVGLNLTLGSTYRLTFDAWSNVSRTMVVGIGLSGAPWTNQVVTRNLTTSRQSFSIDLLANFTNNNSRVIFDLGAATGMVNLDNITLKLVP